MHGAFAPCISACQKSLAEFAARRRKKIKIIFSRDMCVRENTSQAASVEFVRHGRTNYARSRLQTFCRKNPEGFSTVSNARRFCAVHFTASGPAPKNLTAFAASRLGRERFPPTNANFPLEIGPKVRYNNSAPAGVLELVDEVDSKSTAGDSVPVRVRSPAPYRVVIRDFPYDHSIFLR